MNHALQFSNWQSRDAYRTARRADRLAIVVVLAVLFAVVWRFV